MCSVGRFLTSGWVCCGLLAAAAFAGEADRLAAGFHDPPADARPSVYWLLLNGYLNRQHAERELEQLYEAGLRGICLFDMGARGDRAVAPPVGPAFLSDRSVEDIAHVVRIAGRLGMDVELSVASSWDMGGSWVPPHQASMGLYHVEVPVEGPADVDRVLPFPPIPAKAPRRTDGRPEFSEEVAVLAVPSDRRLPGHDFVFRLDPPDLQRLSHAVLFNAHRDDAGADRTAPSPAKEFAIAVSQTDPADGAFREVLRGSLTPSAGPQRFDLPDVSARYVRLRVLSGQDPRNDRVAVGEFELYNTDGLNVVASHVADRTRDGAVLVRQPSALGHDRSWTVGNIHDGATSGPGGCWASGGRPPLWIKTLDDVVDLTERVDSAGRLRWQVPAGHWSILRYVCMNTGERLKVPSPNSDGLATDHLNARATRAFLEYVIGRLQTRLGDLGKTALKHLYLASYEVRGPIWTPDLIERFRHYRGYDMTPYLPALSGGVLVDREVTARFLYDYRKTLGDLLVDAYYRAAVQTAHAAGLGVESEAGGPGPPIHQVPVDALKAQGVLDQVRGEFWPRRPDAHHLWVVKETACAAHIYGKRRVHMEAFTSMHHWQDGPIDLKPAADRAMCEGCNHFVWHTSSHGPPEAGKPGWAYLAGTHLNPNLVWWPMARAFIDYLARCSFLLQQGLPVADVCYYYGDQGFNFVPPKQVDPSLGLGYDYDVTNRDVILRRMSVRNGRIVLPDGMSYALLVLPDRPDMDLDVLQKLEQLVRDGAVVVGPKPIRSNGLTDYPRRDGAVRAIADRLWGRCDGKTVREHAYGMGRIVWGRTLREILGQMGQGADFRVVEPLEDADFDFVHRRSAEADIYFVRNRLPRWQDGWAVFRAAGRPPELWDPSSGRSRPQPVYRAGRRETHVPLRLAPHGSIFVVFRADRPDPGPLALAFEPAHDETGRARDRPLAAATVLDWDGRQARVMVSGSRRFTVRSLGDGRQADVHVDALPKPIPLGGPWQVRFADRLGPAQTVVFDKLLSWTRHPDEEIRFFSGIGTYRCSFALPRDWRAQNRRVFLDLGRLWAMGRVSVNGRSAGVVWKPPYVVEITESVRAGQNELVVEVANTWSNRLVGDASLPRDQRRTRTNVMHTGGHAWKDTPLLESGLFGPVRLLPAQTVATAPRSAPDE